MNIRPYRSSDTPLLMNIFQQNIPKYFDPSEIKDFEEYLAEQPDTYLTIEDNGQIIGGVGYYVKEEDRSGRITWIFFHPDQSRKGHGRTVVEYCLEKLMADDRVQKLVVTTSQHAYLFFEKFGYQVLQTEKDHWGPGLDLYLMERDK